MRCITFLLFSAFTSLFAADRPNVILVMTDDQGYGDLSCHGDRFLKTPNLDRLVSEGVEFDQHYVMPQCTPTRATRR